MRKGDRASIGRILLLKGTGAVVVPGPTHTNVIFDCAVPADWLAAKDHRANKIPAALRKAVSDRWPDHFCVIQLEPIYAKLK